MMLMGMSTVHDMEVTYILIHVHVGSQNFYVFTSTRMADGH